MEQQLGNIMAAMGRGGDNMVAHVRSGDVVIPRDIVLENPEFLTKFKKAMQDAGGDYRTHVAGSGFESINPQTGQPEFFFSGIKSFFRNPGKQISSFFANPISSVLLGPVAGMVGSTLFPQEQPAAPMPQSNLGDVEKEFQPMKPEDMVMPSSLSGRDVGGNPFGTLAPDQQRSFLASEGAFGGGLGPEEEQYYLNTLQRNLISDEGQLGDINSLMPIERTYLSQKGYPTDDTMAFFQALQG